MDFYNINCISFVYLVLILELLIILCGILANFEKSSELPAIALFRQPVLNSISS
jgi:hypothetical protein